MRIRDVVFFLGKGLQRQISLKIELKILKTFFHIFKRLCAERQSNSVMLISKCKTGPNNNYYVTKISQVKSLRAL